MANQKKNRNQDKLLNFPRDKRKWINLMNTYFRVGSYVDNEEYFIRQEFFEEFAFDLDRLLQKWQNRSFAKEFKERFRYIAEEPDEQWHGRDIL